MNKNQEKFPLLDSMVAAVKYVYMHMNKEEVKELDKEIKVAINSNCSEDVKAIANMYAYRVDAYVKRYAN